MEATRITPKPVPQVITLTMNQEEANLLRNITGWDCSIPLYLRERGLTDQPFDVLSELLRSVHVALGTLLGDPW